MNDYGRIALVIRYLDEYQGEQPDLAKLAGRAGLSASHFHRLFSTWAAVTPKDFLQCLTLAHAKALLREGSSVFDAALGSGLSGPGRLHDLCISLEAATPGDVKSGGEGWTITAGLADSPFGRCLIGEGPRGICHLSFVTSDGADELDALQMDWPRAHIQRADDAAARQARLIFEPAPRTPERPALRAYVRGTPFQLRVWRALLKVPEGMLISYGRLATVVDQPGAARAIGSAVGRNPLAWLIPCHRVIRETGAFGEYRWGAVRKRAMVAWESAAAVRRKGERHE